MQRIQEAGTGLSASGTGRVNKTERMSVLPFSREHKARFRELCASGELHAVRDRNENPDSRPWHLVCDLTDSDAARHLETRFRAAAQKAAMAAGAPSRVNRLDWWIGKLTHGRRLLYLRYLIQRSAENCEQVETRALELGQASAKPGDVGGLYRDRYPCDWGEPYCLYDGSPRSFSDPRAEFEWWTKRIWSGFNQAIADLYQNHSPRTRQDKETRKGFKNRIAERVCSEYACMKDTIRGLSYDLAVLQANYIIELGLRGDVAIRAFRDESAGLIESVRTFWRESSKRLGLSSRWLEKEGVHLEEPFREVGEDLRHLTAAMPAEAPTGIPGHEASSSQAAGPENASPEALKVGKRRGRRPNRRRRDAIEGAIRKRGDHWREDLNGIFKELDSQEVPLGDFQCMLIDIGAGDISTAWTWEDLDLAEGEQRNQIIDTLRKYAG